MGHFLQGSNDSTDPSSSQRFQTPINISVLFQSLQVSHKVSDEFIEWGICDLSKFTFTWQAAQTKLIPGYNDWITVKCHVRLSSAKFKCPLKRYTIFHIQEQLLNSGLSAKSKEGTVYYLSKHCSSSGASLASWLLMTLQGDHQGKLSVSNHLQHTCQWEKKGWISACLLLLLKYQFENWSEDLLY